MKKYAQLNGINFEVVNLKTDNRQGKTNNIYEYYEKPSDRKLKIWEDWEKFFKDMEKAGMSVEWWIESYNVRIFTINAVVKVSEGLTWYFRITPTHNYVGAGS